MESAKPIFVICPHCQGSVEIVEVNCAIFRHGVFRSTGEQIPPHSTQENCETWFLNNELFGCGKPFKLVATENNKEPDINYIAIICEYV